MLVWLEVVLGVVADSVELEVEVLLVDEDFDFDVLVENEVEWLVE